VGGDGLLSVRRRASIMLLLPPRLLRRASNWNRWAWRGVVAADGDEVEAGVGSPELPANVIGEMKLRWQRQER
jgi:hypothetical protein